MTGAVARWALLAAVAVLAVALLPRPAWAWTPGTHVFLGEAVMRSLPLLPSSVGDLLRAFPYDFLYGSIAADTSFAKKYAPVGRHCHAWHVGLEIYDGADDEPRKAFGLGYLAHLAADVVAHNFFVPRQLTVTSSTASLGHTYWESRFETHLGERYSRRARDLILRDHSGSDLLLDRILSPTIFTTRTNRRIFRGMVHAADSESWQRIFQLMTENSRWDLTDPEVGRYLDRSYDYIIDFLRRVDRSVPYKLDPAGDEALRSAKKIRRAVIRSRGEREIVDEAERHFGLPAPELEFAARLDPPVYIPARAPSS